jgi:nitroimidazol reductase NimA-like FMN-containing flavoprotein (pyridoxamine 5'-phosphate oxidase superfamily)
MRTRPAASPIDVLTEDECWDTLALTDLGRLALRDGEDVDIFPVNFVVSDRRIYFRSAPGAKMMALTKSPRVAFQTDGASGHRRWSVVVKGTAERLKYDDEIEASGVTGLNSLTPTDKWNYVRITPSEISGRRFEPTR